MYRVGVLFDSRRQREGLVALHAIRAHGGCPVGVALDGAAEQGMRLENFDVVRLEDVETTHPKLAAVRDRPWLDYILTAKPFILAHLVAQFGKAALCDSDVLFYSNPGALFDELRGSGMLVARRENRPIEKICGRFNDGVVAASTSGLDLLKYWQERVIEWCKWRQEGGKWGAEGYLDILFFRPGFQVSLHPGINLSWWNADKHKLTSEMGKLYVDGRPLVCYHFQGFEPVEPLDGGKGVPKEYLELLYRPYADMVR